MLIKRTVGSLGLIRIEDCVAMIVNSLSKYEYIEITEGSKRRNIRACKGEKRNFAKKWEKKKSCHGQFMRRNWEKTGIS